MTLLPTEIHADQSQVETKDNQKKEQKKEQKDDLDEELTGLEEDDFPDLVPAGEAGEFHDELSTLEEDDFPDLVSVDESGEFMDELDFLQDADMVELAARHKQDIGMSPSAVTVFTREDIDASGATIVTDLLRQVPGMEIVNLSPFFPSITGRLIWNYENNSHLVLIDGNEFNMDVLGFAPWAFLPVSLEDIERIEVIRGPGSALYGANALAGVISITTRATGEENNGNMFVQGGEAGNLIMAGQAAFRFGKWGISINGGLDQASSWLSAPRSTARDNWKVRATLEYKLSDTDKLQLISSTTAGEGVLPTPSGTLDTTLFSTSLYARLRTESLRAKLFFFHGLVDGVMQAPLKYAGVVLAEIDRNQISGDTLSGELQWTLPLPWESLLAIVGADSRATWMASPQLLNAETFSDITHPKYHKSGLEYFEIRAAGFAHVEFTPVEWLTVTGGLRIDYNTETGEFLSPRLTSVLSPVDNQFIRLGIARAFRKPTLWETRLHPGVSFPEGGVFVGNAQDQFREFMTRVVGNESLPHEELLSVEAGYLGKFMEEDLTVALDLYYNIYGNMISIHANLVSHPQYLVDLEESSFAFDASATNIHILGSELSLRYKLNDQVQLQASWSYRNVEGEYGAQSPKNMFTLGTRFQIDWGLVGSLFIHTRSEFRDLTVDNPDGIMEPSLTVHMDNIALVLARLGFRRKIGALQVETGAKLHLPVSPFSGPRFRIRERGGGVTPYGVRYGGNELTQILTLYFKASY